MMNRSLVLLGALSLNALGETTIDATSRFAYSPNVGWISFRGQEDRGVVVGEHVVSGLAWGEAAGWINFGDGSPADSVRYSNSAGQDFGVNVGDDGALSGRAWGAAIGWISFDWDKSKSPDRPRIDLDTGQFHGFAYSANVGWINLGAGHLITKSLKVVDQDQDEISDRWEHEHFGNTTTVDESSDHDGDGVSDLSEYTAGTNPKDKKSFLRLLEIEAKDQVSVQFTSRPGRRYRLLVSSDLNSFQDSGLGEITPDSGASTTRTLSRAKGATYFRVVATRPLR